MHIDKGLRDVGKGKEFAMKIKSWPESERPAEKCISVGIESLSNRELLALLIHSGTAHRSAMELAEEVLAKDKSGIVYLREITVQELMSIRGIGPAKAVRIMAAVELGKRVALKPVYRTGKIENDEDVADLFMEDMRHEKREIFKVLLLDSRGGIISAETVSIGELNSTVVHPREVFSKAVKKSAAAMVLIHNHPSGDPSPSAEDCETTNRLVECGRLLGISVVDHLVIGDGKYTSMRAAGKMRMLK